MIVGMSAKRSTPPPPLSSAPAEQRYGLLEELASTIMESAKSLSDTLEGRITSSQDWSMIRDLEHKVDAIDRDLF